MKTELSCRNNFNPYIGSYYEDCIGFSKTDDAQYIDRKKTAQIVASNKSIYYNDSWDGVIW